MITVSKEASEEVKRLMELGGNINSYIRVSVKGGGCSGLMYDLSFDATKTETDTLCEDKGVKILIDKRSLLYLVGTELDYSSGLNGKGFNFINPNASRSCGCGESFAV
jgi:iron-sulfur cluster assembly protein